MTLARRLRLGLLLLAMAMAAALGAVVWGFCGLQRLTDTAHEEFGELRYVQQGHRHLDQATICVGRDEHDQAVDELHEASRVITMFADLQAGESVLDEAHGSMERRVALQALERIDKALARLQTPGRADASEPGANEVVAEIGLAMEIVEGLATDLEAVINEIQDRTVAQLRNASWVLGGLFIVILVSAVALGMQHYRRIIKPLRYVQHGAQRLACGELDIRLNMSADLEFEQLQSDFNHMAVEIESLYKDLERRVVDKSKELVVSERRASIGYLAAGVAHEVNNPLGIISGHAESLLRRMRSGQTDQASAAEVVHGLEIIRDEAFRCKKITEGLLNLSQIGDEQRSPVSMRQVADEVVQLAGASPVGQERTIVLHEHTDDLLLVMGSTLELRQVVLNLVINALQSVPQYSGRVDLHAARKNGWIELQVGDNGCGMSPEILEKVFEPFYTRGRGGNGFGLGLSISHAIAQRHSGRLTAASDGPGKGSVFTLRLPAAGTKT